jgi:SNF2 family DNA or RNA helicase
MGAGKTVATLTAIQELQFAGYETKPALIIAPLRVARDVWPAEAVEWEHLRGLQVEAIVGSPDERLRAAHTRADVYTVNFENLEWLITHFGEAWPFGMIVVDESTKLKSLRANIRTNKSGKSWVQGSGGERAKALLKATYTHKTERFVELTGTPAPLGLQDLWGQCFFLDHGKRLGRIFDAFQNRWFTTDFNGWGMIPQPHAQKEIEGVLKDLCLSLKAEDWFDLAAPIVRKIEVTLPPEARRQYRELEKALFTEIQQQPIEAFNAGAKTMKLLQMASGAAYTGHADDDGPREWVEVHQAKLDALEEIVEESAGASILVSYYLKSDLARLLKRFPKGRALDQNPQTLKNWNAGKIPLLFTNPASAGHGLNLQHGGNILVYFSSDWNGENKAQILERIGPVRQAQSGYTRNVYVYELIARDTIDEDVLVSHETKCSVQEALMNAMRRRG